MSLCISCSKREATSSGQFCRVCMNQGCVRRHFLNYPERRGWAQINKRLKRQNMHPVTVETYVEFLRFKQEYFEQSGRRFSGRGRGFLDWYKKDQFSA